MVFLYTSTGCNVTPAIASIGGTLDEIGAVVGVSKPDHEQTTVALPVVKKHGGALSFECPYGAGTTFIIRLPLQEPPGKDCAHRADANCNVSF